MFLLSGVNVFEARLIYLSQYSKGKETGCVDILDSFYRNGRTELFRYFFIVKFIRKSALNQLLCYTVYVCTCGLHFQFSKVYAVS